MPTSYKRLATCAVITPIACALIYHLSGIVSAFIYHHDGSRLQGNFNDSSAPITFALWRAISLRDADTGEHSRRVRSLAAVLAYGLRQKRGDDSITADFVREIYHAAALHDFGKIAIPDAVLLNPGELTPEQREIMRAHPGLGAAALREINSSYPDDPYLSMAAELAQSHHERWDGSGYPEGLVGENIPLSARIMAVADVYDALANARVYKPAFPPERCVEIIVAGTGSHFDPEIIAVFLECEADFRQLQGSPSMEID